MRCVTPRVRQASHLRIRRRKRPGNDAVRLHEPRNNCELGKMSILASQPGTAKELAAFAAEWLPSEPLAGHTSLAVGGPADVVRIRDGRRLGDLMEYIRARGATWRLLGGGTNLLVADEGLNDVVIHLRRDPQGLRFEGGRVEVPTSSNLGTTVMECAKRNLGGMEGLVGVPGSVGGALHMNAGAYGTEIKDVVRAVTVFPWRGGEIEGFAN